jgi:hypothetical protein
MAVVGRMTEQSPVARIEAGLVASWTRLCRLLPGASLYRHDGLALALSNVGDPTLNGAVPEPGAEPRDPAGAIEVLDGLCAAHNARLAFDLAAGERPRLEKALRDAGLRPAVRRRGMVRPLDTGAAGGTAGPEGPGTGRPGPGGPGPGGPGPGGPGPGGPGPGRPGPGRPGTGSEPAAAGGREVPAGYRVRDAEQSDLPALRRLEAECFGLTGPATERFLPDRMLDDMSFRTVLAERLGARGAEIVAKAHGHLVDGSFGISGVATTFAARRRGLAAALVVELLRGARKQGARWSWLLSELPASGVYLGVGFVHVAEWDVWLRP